MGTYRMPVTLDLAGHANYGVNVWHFRAEETGGPLLGAINSAAIAIHDFYAAIAGGSVLANGTTIHADMATEVGTDEATAVTFSSITVPDSGALAPLPMGVTVNWLTSSASRRGRGRTFLGPLVGGAVQSDGTVAEATLSTIRAAASGLVDDSRSGIGWSVGVYGLEAKGGGPDAPHVLRDFTGSVVHDRFAWLRSRRS